MRKSGNRMKAALALSLACGAVGIGCDDSRTADKRVRQAIHEARLARLKEGGLDQAQTLLQKAANESEAAAGNKASAKSLLARAEMDAAGARMNDREKGIDKTNREIARLLWEINQLGQQVRSSNNLVTSYQAFEPKEARAAAEKQVQSASGPAGQNWVGNPPAAIPTLAEADVRLNALEQQIQQKQAQIAQLQQQQQQQASQAQQFAQAAAGKSGASGFEEFKQASALRKAASLSGVEVENQQAELAKLQHDYALTQTQKQAVATAIEQAKKLAAGYEQGWDKVKAQVAAQQQLAGAVLNGGREPFASIADKAKQLKPLVDQAREGYEEAQKNFESAITHFGEAEQAAVKLNQEMRTASGAITGGGDNQLVKSMKTLMEVYNPNTFKLGQAGATLSLADLLANRAASLAERASVVKQINDVAAAGGATIPADLKDPAVENDAKAVAKMADERFDEALKLYNDVSEGGAITDTQRNAARAGRIYSLYGRSLLARATGDAKNAATYLADAKAQRDLVLQESKGALAALPAELVIVTAATTAPSTTGPARPAARAPATPAATPPAAGVTEPAAPAPGAAAPAAPTDTTGAAGAAAAAGGNYDEPVPAGSGDQLATAQRVDQHVTEQLANLKEAREWFKANPSVKGGIEGTTRSVRDYVETFYNAGATKVFLDVEDLGGTQIPTSMYVELPEDKTARGRCIRIEEEIDNFTGGGGEAYDAGQKYLLVGFD